MRESDVSGQLASVLAKFDAAGSAERELLRFLNDQVLREQEIYWHRFYSFATLHAGALVLFTAQTPARRFISVAGLVLAIAWVYVQWASLHYANRAKELYHSQLKKLTITFDQTSVFFRLLGRRKWASSTNVGLVVAGVVLLAWVGLLIADSVPLQLGLQGIQAPGIIVDLRWLNVLGLALDLIGAVILASGLVISKRRAVDLSVSRYSGDVDEEKLRLPQVRDRLQQSRNAIIGVMFLGAGFVLQIVGSWPR